MQDWDQGCRMLLCRATKQNASGAARRALLEQARDGLERGQPSASCLSVSISTSQPTLQNPSTFSAVGWAKLSETFLFFSRQAPVTTHSTDPENVDAPPPLRTTWGSMVEEVMRICKPDTIFLNHFWAQGPTKLIFPPKLNIGFSVAASHRGLGAA